MITPEGNVTPAGVVPRLKQFNVVGVVKTGLYELDNTLTLTHIEDARTLYRFEGGFAGLRLKLADPQNAPAVVPKLLPADAADRVWARDWTFSNQSYFNAVELEKKMLFVVMFFISLVASINLISTLIMTVTEKQSAIAILRTQGIAAFGHHEDILRPRGTAGLNRYGHRHRARSVAGGEYRRHPEMGGKPAGAQTDRIKSIFP